MIGSDKKACKKIKARVQDWNQIKASAGVAGAVQPEEGSLTRQTDHDALVDTVNALLSEGHRRSSSGGVSRDSFSPGNTGTA